MCVCFFFYGFVVHENELINMTEGFIEPPPLSLRSLREGSENDDDDENSYRWRIFIPHGSYILLNLKQYTSGLKVNGME